MKHLHQWYDFKWSSLTLATLFPSWITSIQIITHATDLSYRSLCPHSLFSPLHESCPLAVADSFFVSHSLSLLLLWSPLSSFTSSCSVGPTCVQQTNHCSWKRCAVKKRHLMTFKGTGESCWSKMFVRWKGGIYWGENGKENRWCGTLTLWWCIFFLLSDHWKVWCKKWEPNTWLKLCLLCSAYLCMLCDCLLWVQRLHVALFYFHKHKYLGYVCSTFERCFRWLFAKHPFGNEEGAGKRHDDLWKEKGLLPHGEDQKKYVTTGSAANKRLQVVTSTHIRNAWWMIRFNQCLSEGHVKKSKMSASRFCMAFFWISKRRLRNNDLVLNFEWKVGKVYE